MTELIANLLVAATGLAFGLWLLFRPEAVIRYAARRRGRKGGSPEQGVSMSSSAGYRADVLWVRSGGILIMAATGYAAYLWVTRLLGLA